MQQLQEQLKNMSPEELKEYQKKNCIFCQIISGKVASKKVFEDDKCIGVLDINPANPGHVLLLPKEHYAILPQVPETEIEHMFMVAKAFSNVMLKALGCGGTNIFVANGVAAGQKAQHFMLHVIPRKEGDNIGMVIPEKQVNENDLEQIKEKLLSRVNEMFGGKNIVSKPRIETVEHKPEVQEAEFEDVEEDEDLDNISEMLGGKHAVKDVGEEEEEEQEPAEEEPTEEEDEPEEEQEEELEEEQPEQEPEKEDKGADLDEIAKLLGGK